MFDRQSIKNQIRTVLDSETDAILLSDKLFGPDGLFNRLASDKVERKAVAQTSLFREAQERLSELRRREAQHFVELVESAQHKPPGESLRLLKVEQT